jgi:hypothetical protein
MNDDSANKKRRTFRWSAEARALAINNLKATGHSLRQAISRLVEITGNPRSACRRFVRRMGNKATHRHKRWPVSEQQRLLEMLDQCRVSEAAQKMRCSPSAIYGMLRRLRVRAGIRQDSISKRGLAAALHVHIYEVDSWIKSGWLKATTVPVGNVSRTVIKPDDLFQFCQQYRERVIGNRLNLERVEFLYKYLFPPDHNYLLSVREHKKKREALRKPADLKLNDPEAVQRGESEGNGDDSADLDPLPKSEDDVYSQP